MRLQKTPGMTKPSKRTSAVLVTTLFVWHALLAAKLASTFVFRDAPSARYFNGVERPRLSPRLLLASTQQLEGEIEADDKSKDDAQNSNDSGESGSNTGSNDDEISDSGIGVGESTTDEFSFFDEARLLVRAGSGGQGASTYKKAKKGSNGIPDGGSGGRGGSVVLELMPSLNTLAGLNEGSGSFRAWDGSDGGRMYDNGRRGEDCVIKVPSGTVVQSRKAPKGSEEEAEEEWRDLGTVSEAKPTLVVARGGSGGEGTGTLKQKKQQQKPQRGGGNKNSVPRRKGPQGGERCQLLLTLKIVADVALVGVPNAGKSTFLAAVTRAKPRIADYPFTTIVPNLGTWIPPTEKSSSPGGRSPGSSSNGLVLCDVPGLIEGASEGVGLGHAFLRHIERCRVLLHLVDATSEDPVRDFAMVNDELKRYGSGNLATKPQVVVLNKMDAFAASGAVTGDDSTTPDPRADLVSRMKQEMGHTRLLWVSAKEKEGVDELMARMASYVGTIREQSERRDDATTPATGR